MRVLIFHGYLLHGTGSNVYNASLARALAELGHEVHLLCQDRTSTLKTAGPGSITIHNPDIGGLLPVYVRDSYEGFDVKTFPELSDAELDRYLEANVFVVREVAEQAGGIDAALANHLVMGPAILARAGLPCGFAAKVHGSALEYTVKPHPRFLPHAREGMAAARGVLVGSRHTAESLWRTIADPALGAKTRLGPPGVDVDLFRSHGREEADEELRRIATAIEGDAGGAFGREPGRAASALRDFAAAVGPRVLFVGKLIEQKGVHLLLRAWPAVAANNPGARLLIAGFGEDEASFKELADDTVLFSGRLEHEEVAVTMAAADALVMPSVFPEAFGMVAAEAAAAGALPISADHSGMREVSRQLAARLPDDVAGLVSFPVDERAPAAIAERLNTWLALDTDLHARCQAILAEAVAELWSWHGVARGVLAAAAGHLDGLPAVPSD